MTCEHCGGNSKKKTQTLSKLRLRNRYGVRFETLAEYTFEQTRQVTAAAIGIVSTPITLDTNQIRLGQMPIEAIKAYIFIHSTFISLVGFGGVAGPNAYAAGVVGWSPEVNGLNTRPLLAFAGSASLGYATGMVNNLTVPIPLQVGNPIGAFYIDNTAVNIDTFTRIDHRVRVNYSLVYEATED